ncbi:MAG: hypothetical protein PHI37_00865 [Candidatus Gracilibacteria bacterium]|nr:hypothetical protein [Candidatus Gracilibacteria bacterium]
MNNIIFSDKQRFEKIISNIKKGGYENLHILSDFDKTLTKEFIDGEKRPSLISILRRQNILGEEYSKKAYDLFDYYNPIEINPNIDIEDKKIQMTIWWEKHLDLLVKSGLKKQDIDKAINSGIIKFRDGVKDFLSNMNDENVPIVIISANALGSDSNYLFLEQNGVNISNIKIISNSFIWDDNGNAIGYNKPVIHVFNKDETVLKSFPEIYDNIKSRKNVILLGDSLGDPGMIHGFEYDNLLKIGFLNDKVDELLEDYKKHYDVVIVGDGEFDFVNEIIKTIK